LPFRLESAVAHEAARDRKARGGRAAPGPVALETRLSGRLRFVRTEVLLPVRSRSSVLPVATVSRLFPQLARSCVRMPPSRKRSRSSGTSPISLPQPRGQS
jgi:hypothetical protein